MDKSTMNIKYIQVLCTVLRHRIYKLLKIGELGFCCTFSFQLLSCSSFLIHAGASVFPKESLFPICHDIFFRRQFNKESKKERTSYSRTNDMVVQSHGDREVNSGYQELGELSPPSQYESYGPGDQHVSREYQELGELDTSSHYDTQDHGARDVKNAYQELGELSPPSHYDSQGHLHKNVNREYQELGEISPPSTYDSIR
jgi:hypothetical protein